MGHWYANRPHPKQTGLGQRHPEGHAWAPMVLGPFAETKGPRCAGAKPRIKTKTLDSRLKMSGMTDKDKDSGSSIKNVADKRQG